MTFSCITCTKLTYTPLIQKIPHLTVT